VYPNEVTSIFENNIDLKIKLYNEEENENKKRYYQKDIKILINLFGSLNHLFEENNELFLKIFKLLILLLSKFQNEQDVYESAEFAIEIYKNIELHVHNIKLFENDLKVKIIEKLFEIILNTIKYDFIKNDKYLVSKTSTHLLLKILVSINCNFLIQNELFIDLFKNYFNLGIIL
jgi:hypothetical protein